MERFALSKHVKDQMRERDIEENWVHLTIEHGSESRGEGDTLVRTTSRPICQDIVDLLTGDAMSLKNKPSNLNTLEKIHKLIESAKRLKLRGGIEVVFDPISETIITAYDNSRIVPQYVIRRSNKG